MSNTYKKVYQFEITLNHITPTISRTIQIPEDYSFWDLHVAIQDAMGWQDYHLHQFKITNPKDQGEKYIGIPDDDFPSDDKILPGWEESISEYFSLDNSIAEYEYDFGDGWEHIIKLEQILEKQSDKNYPVCINGTRACPPEDCGGPWGYSDLLEALADENHEEHENMKNWLSKKFDPELFNPKKVKFTDPHKRWKLAFKKNPLGLSKNCN